METTQKQPTFEDITLMYSLICQVLDADSDAPVLKFEEFCAISQLSIRLRHAFKAMLAERIVDAARTESLPKPSNL